MGYEVHIVRRKNWNDLEEVSNISLEEWLQYVATDMDLKLTNGFEIKFPGAESTFQNVPGFCIWLHHPTMKDGDEPWFDYGFGCLTAKNPDELTIRKMMQIAATLNAKVQGDHEEFYDDAYFEKEMLGKNPSEFVSKKPWWRFW